MPVDILIGLYCLWIALSLFIAHGTERIAFIGITIVELFGGYLVGRTLVLGQKDYRAFFRYFFLAMLFLLPFVLIEQMTRRLLISEIVGIAFPTYPYVNFEPADGSEPDPVGLRASDPLRALLVGGHRQPLFPQPGPTVARRCRRSASPAS